MPRTLSEAEFNAVKDKTLSMAPKGLSEAEFSRWWSRQGQNIFNSELTTAEHMPPAPEGSAVGRFFGSALSMLDPRPLAQMAADIAVPSAAGVLRQAEMGGAILDTSMTQGRRAVEAFKTGTPGGVAEAVAHGVAAIPVAGAPFAQFDEQMRRGDVAGGLGTGATIVGSAMAPAVVRDVRSRMAARVPALEKAAATGYEKALDATTRENKVRAARVAPEMAKRGIVERNLPALEARAAEASDKAGQAVGAMVAQAADRPVDVLPLVEQLEHSKADFIGTAMDGRRVVNDPAPVAAIQRLQDTLMEYGDQISAGSMNKLRQNWDAIVQRAKGFTTDDVKTQGWAAREGRTALREALSQVVPDADQVMAEYAFWQNIEDITHATNVRKVSQRGSLTPSIAGGAGAIVGELVAPGSGAVSKIGMAALGAKTGAMLRRLIDSPGYQMLSASFKQHLADALASGNEQAVQGTVSQGLRALSSEATAAVTTASGESATRRRATGLVPQAATP